MPTISGRTVQSSGKRVHDARYTAAVIPPFVLAGLIDYARTRGVNPDSWFRGLAIKPEQCYEAETRVSFRQISFVIRQALRAFPNDSVGLAIGSRESLASFGVLGFAMMSSRTFGEALAVVKDPR